MSDTVSKYRSLINAHRLDPDKSLRQRHRFTLVRQEGQDPIRGNGPEKRPTSEEIKEYHKHQRLSGKTSKGQN